MDVALSSIARQRSDSAGIHHDRWTCVRQDHIAFVYIEIAEWVRRGKRMKYITLSADERLIEAARARARAHKTTLNEEFRRWLTNYVQREQQADEALRVAQELQGRVRVGRKLNRDERNER